MSVFEDFVAKDGFSDPDLIAVFAFVVVSLGAGCFHLKERDPSDFHFWVEEDRIRAVVCEL